MNKDSDHMFVDVQWPAPPRVRVAVTTRRGGVSRGPYSSLNLADHVGDADDDVARNRARVHEAAGLPAIPTWLRQVHGARVVDATATAAEREADGAVALAPGAVCAVLTADCLPVLVCDRRGSAVGVAHAGWRGLAAGVIENTVRALACPASEVLAWLGPAIGPRAFEVGPEVRQAFLDVDDAAAGAFAPAREDRWLADLYHLAALRLAACGVPAVYGGGFCTYTDRHRFFSYRRDGRCGRMAALIWLAPDGQ